MATDIGSDSLKQLRRIVIGLDKTGKSTIVSDGPSPNTVFDRVTEIWKTSSVPTHLTDDTDGALGKVEMNPPEGGTIFRYIELPPAAPDDEQESEREALADVAVDTTHHPLMHRTRSLDYVVLLSGQAALIVEDQEIAVNPFDVIVQRGANHAWVNRGSEPVMLLAVMIDAIPNS